MNPRQYPRQRANVAVFVAVVAVFKLYFLTAKNRSFFINIFNSLRGDKNIHEISKIDNDGYKGEKPRQKVKQLGVCMAAGGRHTACLADLSMGQLHFSEFFSAISGRAGSAERWP